MKTLTTLATAAIVAATFAGSSAAVNPRYLHRGDVVAFLAPPLIERCGGEADSVHILRIVGLPGETWQERNGLVYVNGKRLIEPYVKPDRRDTAVSYPARKIPRGRYFLMGDNRVQSCDSREWGSVPSWRIVQVLGGMS